MSPDGDKREGSPDGEGAEAPAEPPCDCVGARLGTDRGKRHYRMGAEGWEPVPNVGKGTGPCCEAPDWPGCRDCPHYPKVSRLLEEMAEARPADAPVPEELTGEAWEIEACQMAAFRAGDEDWWCYGEDWVLHTRDESGVWRAQEEGEGE